MTDIEMSLPTRVRVIEHALKLLDAFNEKFRAALADGSVRMNAEVQMMARTNAEGEGRLRRRLAKLRKEMQSSPAPAGIDNGLANTPNSDCFSWLSSVSGSTKTGAITAEVNDSTTVTSSP